MVLPEEEESSFDPKQIWSVIRAKVWLVLLLGAIGGVGGWAYLRSLPTKYFAQVVLQVDPQEVQVVSFQQNVESRNFANQDVLDSLVATIRSRPFLGEVVANNNLLSEPEFLGDLPVGRVATIDDGVNILMGAVQTQVRRGTRFIEIAVRHRNAQVAQQVANALGTELIRQMIKQRAATSQMAIDFLMQQAEKLKKQLQASEESLQDYVEKSNSISLKERQDTVVTKLKNQSSLAMDARATRLRLEADYEAIKKLADQPRELLNLSSVASSPMIAASKQQITDLESRIAMLALRYTAKHPRMIQAKMELADANASLLENLSLLPSLVHSAYEAALAKEQKFDVASREQEKFAMDLNKQAIKYNVLSRDVETDRALYESILRRLGETEVAKGIEVTPVHIFESALPPTHPIEAGTVKILALAIGGGMGLGLAIIFGLNALDRSFRTVEQAERLTSLRVAAAIPKGNPALADTGLILQYEPGSAIAESFRSLRTFLYLAGRRRGRKTLLFTSAVPGEGKTFCSINCATALAQQGLRTVLIDADLRAPMIGNILMPGKQVEGLTAWLEGTSTQVAIHGTDIENLFVIPAGHLAVNPAELLAKSAFGDLIQELEQQFDFIVIDTAPVLTVSDTLLLVEHAQTVCLVAQAGKTARTSVLRASKLLAESGAKPAGLLLNQLPESSATGDYPYVRKYGVKENYSVAPNAVRQIAVQVEDEA